MSWNICLCILYIIELSDYFERTFLTKIILAFGREIGPEYQSGYMSLLNLKLSSLQVIHKKGELLCYSNRYIKKNK